VSFSRHTGEKREVRGFAELKKKWEKLRKEYGVQMKELLHARASSADPNGDFDDEMQSKIREMYGSFRERLLEDYEEESEAFEARVVHNLEGLLIETSAMFVAAYEHSSRVALTEGGQHESPNERGPSLQFPWRVAGDYLVKLKCERNKRPSGATYSYSPSELRKMLMGTRT